MYKRLAQIETTGARDLIAGLLIGDIQEGDFSAEERRHMHADDEDGTFAWHLWDDQLDAAMRGAS